MRIGIGIELNLEFLRSFTFAALRYRCGYEYSEIRYSIEIEDIQQQNYIELQQSIARYCHSF